MLLEEKPYLTIREAALGFHVTRATLYQYMRDLGMKTRRFGRERQTYLSAEQVQLIQEYKEKPWILQERKSHD